MMFQRKGDEGRSQTFSPERPSLVASDVSPQSSLAKQRPKGLPPRAVIDANVKILGCLRTDGEVQVDGQINGDVRSEHLTVGKTGTIIGDISAKEVVIRGKVKGAIRAGRVLIQECAHVESDICHDKLAIEEGAYFRGCSTHNVPKELQEPEPHMDALRQAAIDMKSTA
jgi:cytoskeletal protein CcmA (bactofilin family)